MEVFIDSVMTQRKVAWSYILTLLKWNIVHECTEGVHRPCFCSQQHMRSVQADAITDDDFEQLLDQLQHCDPADRAARIATAARFCFFTSLQVNPAVKAQHARHAVLHLGFGSCLLWDAFSSSRVSLLAPFCLSAFQA